MAVAPQPRFCLGDQVLTNIGLTRWVLDSRLTPLGTFEYTLVDGTINLPAPEPSVPEASLTLVLRGVGPRYNVGDTLIRTIGPVTVQVLDRGFTVDDSTINWAYLVTGIDMPFDGLVGESQLTLLDGTVPPQPEPCPTPVRCTLVERDTQGSGVVLSGVTTGVEFFEAVTLVATIANDDGRRDNITWQASHGRIISQNWNEVLYQAANFDTPALVDIFIDGELQLDCRSTFQTPTILPAPPSIVTCNFIERAPRFSGVILSRVVTNVEPGETLSLVAHILNDDGRRDNIIWSSQQGTIEFQQWDQAVYTAPEVSVIDVVDITIDQATQFGARCLFSVPAAPLSDPELTQLEDFLNIGFWQTLANRMSDVFQGTEETIPQDIADLASLLGGTAQQTFDDLAGLPGQVKDSLDPSLAALGNTVISEILTGMVPVFGGQLNPIADVIEALNIPSFTEWLSLVDEAGDAILSAIIRRGIDLVLEGIEQGLALVGAPLWPIILEALPPGDPLRGLVEQLINPTEPAAALLGQAAGGAAVSGSITGIIAPQLRALEHFANRNLPNVLMDPGSVTRLAFRRVIEGEELEAEYRSAGFDALKQFWWQELLTLRPDLGLVNSLLLRNEMQQAAATAPPLAQALAAEYAQGIEEAEAFDRLILLGWERESIDLLLDQRKFIPSIQDLVSFAVREAFGDPTDPTFIERFGLDDEFPPEILPFTRGQGAPDEVARLFWRAHWELPSTQQGFEMLHRSSTTPFFAGQTAGPDGLFTVIDDQELDTLFKQADILPYWRERLKAISFAVITRVDVRRMYDLGIFDLADVERTYRSLGYTPEDAANLTAFVERLALQPRLTARNTEARQQFRDGLIDRVRAEDLLRPLIPLEAELQAELETLDLDRAGTRLTREVTAWQTAFRKELISEADFRAELTRLELPAEEIDFRVRIILIARVAEDPTPEQEELRAAGRGIVIRRFREGLVDQPQFALEMASLGYTDLQIAQFGTQADLEFDTNVSLDLLAAYRAGLRTGRLAELEFRTLTQALGIRAELIDAYIEFDQLRRKLEGPSAEEQELRAFGSGPILSRFQEGWTTPGEFAFEMESVGYTAPEIQRYQLVADLRFDFDFKQDSLTVLRNAFNKRVIDGDEFLSRLATLGMDPARAAVHLAREQLRLLDRLEAAEITPEELGLPGG